VDFSNLKPSDIISGAFASDGPKEQSGTARQQAAQLAALKEQIESGEMTGINVNNVTDPLEAVNIVMVGMVTAIKGFEVLRDTKKITRTQFAAFMKSAKAIHKLWKAAVEVLHNEHKAANGGKCDCDEHNA
jgi:hypothetical protein